MVRLRGRNYFAHIIQHDYVFHPDSGNLKQSPFTSQRNGKISFWIAAGLILLANEIS